MSLPPSPAILLRRISHGDYDLIVTFLTPDRGKLSLMAKSAKKSVKRFAGVLEPFAVLEIVASAAARPRGLPMLLEAAIKHPFSSIRGDVIKTAYASYWSQLIAEWAEENVREPELYRLFRHVLDAMDTDAQPPDALSILFQMRFLVLAGLAPNLEHCCACGAPIDGGGFDRMRFDLARGGLLCPQCAPDPSGRIVLSKGTIKPLRWLQNGGLSKAGRVRFTPHAVKESQALLEAFVPFHLGRDPRSLRFLKEIRK